MKYDILAEVQAKICQNVDKKFLFKFEWLLKFSSTEIKQKAQKWFYGGWKRKSVFTLAFKGTGLTYCIETVNILKSFCHFRTWFPFLLPSSSRVKSLKSFLVSK